ncbi:chimeric ERCC6-PGBD3 protein-like isoform X2 [Octopus vulgaris]|uniref:Chimeric ERCC6-PGBD3 protein-like isoform X2 n=1 Tax=Octopus vulgaris TaxID=6645 RepID=A0AA36AK92_OCTVU|nr:chimeric ERCC6-PGBD3 protein-like isoform X2 [Octopus vulgaris]
MENTRRKAYDAAFKLKAINLVVEEGNRAAARKLGINESMVKRWRRQQEEQKDDESFQRFRKAGLLRDEEDRVRSSESDNEEAEVSDEILKLFNSDTEEEDFDYFRAQEEDEEGDQ